MTCWSQHTLDFHNESVTLINAAEANQLERFSWKSVYGRRFYLRAVNVYNNAAIPRSRAAHESHIV